jgi:phosphoglycolate phosphatase-like HAD superfamily hydrolase
MIRAAVFDFDGVVLESVEIKTIAFRRLFADHPDGERIVPYHQANGGISRFKKFQWFYEEVRGEPLSEDESARLGERFSELVLDEIRRCPFVPGARELLEGLAPRLPLFVASGTPEDELRGIVADRGLDHLFAGVYGTPPTKAEILRRIMDERGWEAGELVFVGDAMSDYKGASAAGVPFVGRCCDGEPSPFPDGTFTVLDLAELDARWGELDASPPPVPTAR